MEQLHQLTRTESESFTELPSYLKEKLDFGDDFDLFSPGPAGGQNDLQTGGFQSMADPQLALFSEESFAVPKICDRSPFSRMKALNYLENIIEEESYELDNSKFTERLESFNELDQYSFRKTRMSKDCLLDEGRNSNTNGTYVDNGFDQFLKMLPSPKSLAQPEGGNRFVLPQSIAQEHPITHSSQSNFTPIQDLQLSPDPRAVKRDIQPSLQFMRQSRSGEEKALAEHEIGVKPVTTDAKQGSNFHINRISTSSSETEHNFDSEGTDPNLKSTINIYQSNNIVINITNDNSKTLNSVKKAVNNSLTKNVYYDLQKFPTNAFSKKKAEPTESSPYDSNMKPKQSSNANETGFGKVLVPSEKKRGSKLKASDRSEPTSSSNFDKKYRNSKVLQQTNPESESISNLMMKSDFFSTARKQNKAQIKVLDHFASTHATDGFAFKSPIISPMKNFEPPSKVTSQEESSKILHNLYKDSSNFTKKSNSSAKAEFLSSQSNFKQSIKENQSELLKKFKEFKEVHEKTMAAISHNKESGGSTQLRNPAKRVSAVVTANLNKKTSHRSKSITPSDTDGLLFDGKHYSKKSQFGVPLQTQSQILRPIVSETVSTSENPGPSIKSSFGSTSSKFFSDKFISLASSQTFLNCGVPMSLQHSSILGKTSSAIPKENFISKPPVNVTREGPDFPGVGSITLFRTGVFENHQERSRRSKTKGLSGENAEPDLKGCDKHFKSFYGDSTGSLHQNRLVKPHGKVEQATKLRGGLEISKVNDLTKSSMNFMPSNPDLQKILVDNQRIYNKAKKILKY